jgi:murein DD-endopeptidase MepM/ murein hydrolase activator NlpD
MRRAHLVLLWAALAGCPPPEPPPQYPPYQPPPDPELPIVVEAPANLAALGRLDVRSVDFKFEGGQLEFEMYSEQRRVVQIARNRYMVPVVISWSMTALENVEATSTLTGVAYLPPAPAPNELGPAVVLTNLHGLDSNKRYRRELYVRARFGDPRARPYPYDYALPYPHGQTFAVLQGFHGEFSHRGSNEYAVDFDCPVATPVLAARPGVIVVANAAAQGSGTTAEYLDYKRTNFVIVRHDDGTLGEYMHLSPSSVIVKPGERVERGQPLALSGNTGFSSTPHLHFQVMTAAPDGVAAVSFPFTLAASASVAEEPVQGRRYTAWEQPLNSAHAQSP